MKRINITATPLFSFIAALALAAGCASDDRRADYPREESPEYSSAASEVEAASVSKVKFTKASAKLDAQDKQHIRSAIQEAKGRGEIDEIKVVVWADQKYPQGSTKKLSDSQRKLAKNRGEEIRNYVEEQLDVSDVDVYNMAERPNSLERLLNTSDARVKNALERSGVNEETGLSTPNQSQALVMVVMED